MLLVTDYVSGINADFGLPVSQALKFRCNLKQTTIGLVTQNCRDRIKNRRSDCSGFRSKCLIIFIVLLFDVRPAPGQVPPASRPRPARAPRPNRLPRRVWSPGTSSRKIGTEAEMGSILPMLTV